MQEAGHWAGGSAIYRRFPIRATIANPGVVGVAVTDIAGINNPTTTSFADAVGLVLESATYSTTQTDLDDPGSDTNIGAMGPTTTGLDMGKVVTVSIRPDLIIGALCSGAAAESTALTQVTNTAASAGGTLITDATNIGAADMVSGIVWCTSGNNVGLARPITTHTASTSFTVTVPFPRAIAVNDTFLWVPYNTYGSGAANLDGVGNLQTSTLFTQADASIASGTGGLVVVTNLELLGRTTTKVYFTLQDHQLINSTN